MLKIITNLALFILSSSIFAQSGFYFLRTEKSPTTISAAQTSYLYVASPENAEFNPASGFGTDMFSVKISYRSLFEKADITQITACYTENKQYFGLEISSLNIGGLEGYEKPSDDPLYEFNSKNLVLSLSYAYKIQPGLKAGITGKYLFEKIEFEDAYGFAVSAGIFSEDNFLENLNLSFAVNNFGKMGRLDAEISKLPSDILFGAGYRYKFNPDFKLNIGNSTRYLLNDEEIENFSGFELLYLDKIALRTGYRANNEGMPLSFGFGFLFKSVSFDYSYTPFSDEIIGGSYAVSMGFVK